MKTARIERKRRVAEKGFMKERVKLVISFQNEENLGPVFFDYWDRSQLATSSTFLRRLLIKIGKNSQGTDGFGLEMYSTCEASSGVDFQANILMNGV